MPRVTRTRPVIAVPDLARSAAFYRDVLGFSIREVGDPGWRFYERDGVIVMAGECVDATPAEETGDHAYFAYLDVEGIDDYYAAVRDAIPGSGGKLIKKLRDEPWGMREFALQTVDGHRIMFGSPLARA